MQRFQPTVYIQDNWRVSPKLTLNLGLRDDLVTPWGERADRLSGFVPTGGGTLVMLGTPPYYGNTITRGRYTNWGPRVGFTVAPQNPFNLATNRGNSDFDNRQRVVLSWSYRLPFGRGKAFATDARGFKQVLIGGWQLNSIDTFQTGAPFTTVMATSLLNSGPECNGRIGKAMESC